MAKVLIVDDDLAIRNTMRRTLADSGHEILLARDGSTALEEIVAHNPDLVVSDLDMYPGMDGVELALEVAKKHPNVPIILWTNGCEAEEATKKTGRPCFDKLEAFGLGVNKHRAIRPKT